jgi:hypothetical protein
VSLADGNTPRIGFKHFLSIVTPSVIHYPIRRSWRPRSVTGAGQILAEIRSK